MEAPSRTISGVEHSRAWTQGEKRSSARTGSHRYRGRPSRALHQLLPVRPRYRPCGAGAGGVGGQLVEAPMGQLHPGHSKLDHPPPGSGVSRARPRRIHGPGRIFGVSRAVGEELRLPGTNRRQRDGSRSRRERAVARRYDGRSPRSADGRRGNRLDAGTPPTGVCGVRFASRPAARCGDLPQSRGSRSRNRFWSSVPARRGDKLPTTCGFRAEGCC